jgi:hypothetical protein
MVKRHFFLYLTNYVPRCEDVWGGVCVLLSSALEGGEWLASRLCRLTSGETAHGNHCTGGWMDLTAGLDVMVKRRILAHAEN